MPILSEKGNRQLLQNLQPMQFDVSDNPTFGETNSAAFQYVRDEERSISAEFNNQSYYDRRETVLKAKEDGIDLSAYTNMYGEFNYDRLAEDTGLVKSDREIFDERNQFLEQRRSRNKDIMERGNGFAQFLGMAGSYIVDPINIATLPFGGVGTTAKSLSTLSRVLVGARNSAGIAVASEAAIQPLVYSHKQTIGSPYEVEDALRVIGITALTAGVLGGGIQGVSGYLSKTAEKSAEYIKTDLFPQAPYKYTSPTVQGNSVGIPTLKNIEATKQKILTEQKEKLVALASEGITRGERKKINESLVNLRKSLEDLESEPLYVPEVGKGKKRKAAKLKRDAEVKRADRVRDIKSQINRLETQLKKDQQAGLAKADLSRIEQGILPQRVQKELDDWITKSTTAEEKAVFAIELFAENLRLQKGFRAEEVALKAFEAQAKGTIKSIDEARAVAIEDLNKSIAEATDPKMRDDLVQLKNKLETAENAEDAFNDILKTNIDKDIEIIANNSKLAREFDKRTVTLDELEELPLPPAPKAQTTSLQAQALEDAGFSKQFDHEMAVYNSIDEPLAIKVADDGEQMLVDAKQIIKDIDDELEGLESIMRCTRG